MLNLQKVEIAVEYTLNKRQFHCADCLLFSAFLLINLFTFCGLAKMKCATCILGQLETLLVKSQWRW